MSDGRLLQINVSAGGVPKLPVTAARIGIFGMEGDRQREVTVHGGPHRAVSLLGIEAIRRVAAEGHPIKPGTTGENLTVEGFDVSALPVGTRLAIGDEVVLELSASAAPCRTIRHSFRDLRFGRLSVAAHPTDGRMYARVLHTGVVRPGDPIRIEPPADDAAERFGLAQRIDRAERASWLALWRAAVAAGMPLAILDDGELAAAACATLRGPAFNQALGFAHLPNLVDRATEHFRHNGGSGWIWAEAPPWPDAPIDSVADHLAGPIGASRAEAPDGIVVRELTPSDVGPWAAPLASAAQLSPSLADAYRALEPHLAHAAHHHRFVAERDGHAIGSASLHVHRGVGWLGAAEVDPAHGGRVIGRALIAARMTAAGRRGCELVGASAESGSVTAQDLAQAGLRRVAVRRRYRFEPSA